MIATRRRFNPNLQKVRVLLNGVAWAYVCTKCPQGRQGPKGRLTTFRRPSAAGARAKLCVSETQALFASLNQPFRVLRRELVFETQAFSVRNPPSWRAV